MTVPKRPEHNFSHLRNSDLIAYAVKFLSENYNLNVSPDIIENPYLTTSLTNLLQQTSTNEDGKEFVFYTLEVSSRLLNYYTKDEILSVINNNLIEFAYSYKGKDLTQAQFQNELVKLNVKPISTIPIRGEVYKHICKNINHHPDNQVMEYHYHTRMLTSEFKGSAELPCPVCGGQFTIEKTIIPRPE